MIYITGDTHRNIDIEKLETKHFPEGQKLTRNDYLIITGDFGGIWYGDERDEEVLNYFEKKKYTTLFIDGNHENFDVLSTYPVNIWKSGKVQVIRDNLIHLMRGQVYDIDDKIFFTFGGGTSIDKNNRIPNVSWWQEEIANFKEINEAIDNLKKYKNKVDYIITHVAPEEIIKDKFYKYSKIECPMEKFMNYIYENVKYKMWFCGHYHKDIWLSKENIQILYKNIVKLSNGYPIMNR